MLVHYYSVGFNIFTHRFDYIFFFCHKISALGNLSSEI